MILPQFGVLQSRLWMIPDVDGIVMWSERWHVIFAKIGDWKRRQIVNDSTLATACHRR